MKPEIAEYKQIDTTDDSDVESIDETESTTLNGNGVSVEEAPIETLRKQQKQLINGATTSDLKCEIKEYEARYSLNGTRQVKEKGQKEDADDEKSQYAVRAYKYYSRDGKIEEMRVEIHSPSIQDALRNVVKHYPTQNFDGPVIHLNGWTVAETMGCLYHHRNSLKKYAKNHEDLTAKMHILTLITYTEREFRRAIHRYESSVTYSKTPSIGFDDVWMVFKPGELAFYDAARKTESILEIHKASFIPGDCRRWEITAKVFAHDGVNFGYHHRKFDIKNYEGTIEIAKLLLYPLKFYKGDVEQLRQRMIARGRKFQSLVGVQYRAYAGLAWAVEYERVATSWGGLRHEYPQEAIMIKGRIMLDCPSFIEHRTHADIFLESTKKVEDGHIIDDDLLISNFKIPGFSLADRRWCWFMVDNVCDIEFNEDAFDALLFPAPQKQLIQALTEQSTVKRSLPNDFDDFIKHKGKGCIFLLHGEPGVGKTFTVESIADKIHRPYYVLMSGDLGSNIEAIEKNLTKILKLVTKWRAILLLDEADVFLEARSSHDLIRNGLVSIFLRTLEYFEGIMFLTTNRVTTFDLAFQSRIHLALKYPPLDTNQRTELWRMFLRRTAQYDPGKWPDELVRQFASVNLNGRQVKNAIRTANALALSRRSELSSEDIHMVLSTMVSFNDDFSGLEQSTQQLSFQ